MMAMSGRERASYVFIPGKNWRLSLAELTSFLAARKLGFVVCEVWKSFFVMLDAESLASLLIGDLGGTVKIGRVVSRVPLETVEEAFVGGNRQCQAEVRSILGGDCNADEVFRGLGKKCVFGVSLYFDDSRFFRVSAKMLRFFGDYFKGVLESRGVKARFLGFPKGRKLPQLTHVEVLKRGLVEKSAEIMVCIGEKEAFVAKTVSVHDPFEFQKRDVGRPFQRKVFSMPPRLARIMVNLSSCLPGKVLVDPFCGVGTVLQEAMLLNASVVGVDVDGWCVRASCANLEWLEREYGVEAERRVLQGDARDLTRLLGERSVDCVVTEPELGPALRHLPTEAYARRVVAELKPLFCGFLREAFGVLREGGRLVFVSPLIRTRAGSVVSLDVEEEARAVGFVRVCPFSGVVFASDGVRVKELLGVSSFVDMERRHRVGREVHVLQK